jgi:type II secretory pathway component GspD/PulD (secretin)
MVRTFLAAIVAGGLLIVSGGPSRLVAQEAPKGARKGDPAASAQRVFPVADLVAPVAAPAPAPSATDIVDFLHNQRLSYGKDLQTTPLSEVLQDLAKQYKIPFVINKAAIENSGALNESKAERLSATKIDGLTLGKFLTIYLRSLVVEDVTFLVRDDHIEITSRQAAQQESGLLEAIELASKNDDPSEVIRARNRLNLPLVCVAVDSKPLGTVLTELSRAYGLNVVIDTNVQVPLKTPLTERLLNVPADTALELLAGQAGLSVVRKGNTFRVTTGPGAQ